MKIKLHNILIRNFKGIRELDIDFSDKTTINGRNASGKTTVMDAFTWLLFDKDSHGNANFAIRPKDENGVDIDNIEIKVEGTLEVDGEAVTLTKIQKQKWVKKRGSESQVFEGNVNEFQIDGFPAKLSEYKAKVASIVDENLFKLLTSPKTFASMKWQDQRKMLLEFVSDITDREILETDPKYAPIAADVFAAGADKTREKAMSALKELKKQQTEFPVRIDEAMRSKVDVDSIDELTKRRNEAEAELILIANERDSLDSALKSVSDVQTEMMNIEMAIGNIKIRVAEENRKHKSSAIQETEDALNELKTLERKRDQLCDKVSEATKEIADNEAEIAELAKEYKTIRARVMPEDETKCPTCGRVFGDEKLADIKTQFEARKKRDLGRVESKGKLFRADVDDVKSMIAKMQTEINTLTGQVVETETKYKELLKAAQSVTQADFREDPEYKKLSKRMVELQAQLTSMDNGDERKQALSDRQKVAQAALDEVKAELATVDANKRIDTRIEALRAEQKECSQKVADQERIVYLLEEYVKAKMDLLSDRINSKFKHVRFRLFTEQINGGIKETCVMQINSNGSYVDYADANSAAKIQGGLDVISALSELYGVTAPVFIDNRESVTILPDIDAQVISLVVSPEDKQLRVVNE